MNAVLLDWKEHSKALFQFGLIQFGWALLHRILISFFTAHQKETLTLWWIFNLGTALWYFKPRLRQIGSLDKTLFIYALVYHLIFLGSLIFMHTSLYIGLSLILTLFCFTLFAQLQYKPFKRLGFIALVLSALMLVMNFKAQAVFFGIICLLVLVFPHRWFGAQKVA